MRHPQAPPLQPLQPLFLLPPSLLAARNRALNRAPPAAPARRQPSAAAVMRHPHAPPLQPLRPLFLLPPSLLAARNRALQERSAVRQRLR
jgi:hypothetical protein